MASTKISALAAGAPAQATDLFPIARAGNNFSLQMSDLIGGATNTAVVFSTNGVPTQSADLTYNDTTKRLQVGSSGTSTGWVIGYRSATGQAALYKSDLTASDTTFTLASFGTGQTVINSALTNDIHLNINNVTKLTVSGNAGRGLLYDAGTLTGDFPLAAFTRTNNNSAVVKGFQIVYTDTTSAAGFLPFQVLGGASGTTNLLSVDKSGNSNFGGTLTATSQMVSPYFQSNLGLFFVNSNSGTGVTFGTSQDSNVSRISAGLIGVGTGAAGSTAGSLSLTNLTASGNIAIGNTVAAAVAVASTHKVTILIGGVTYYLLATNVP